MAVTAFLRRWAPAIQTAAALVAIAIIARCWPSPKPGAAIYDVRQQSASVHAMQVAAQHALCSVAEKVVRVTGPCSVPLFIGRAIVSGRGCEFSRGRLASPASAVVICYDATAPPGMLLT